MEQHTDLNNRHRKILYKSQLNSDTIRLLQILPGEVAAPLQCRLIEVSLTTAPVYEAISYAWGDPNITEPVLCDEIEVKITVSLAQALRRLRYSPTTSGIDAQNERVRSTQPSTLLPTDQTRILWADALCINQQNSTEKSHQVQLMKEVYSRAAQVIVWLGPGEPEIAATAVAAIKLVHSTVPNSRILEQLNYDSIVALMSENGFQDPWVPLMLHFFASPWFPRTWCVQEVVLAQDITFVFGNEQVHVSELEAFCEWYAVGAHKNPEFFRLPNAAVVIKAVYRFKYCRTNFELWTKEPLTLLDNFRDLEATDLRDKVYGLLGLMEDVHWEVDYEKSVVEVYADTVMHFISTDNDLRCLSYVRKDSEYDSNAGFPSWVPRWDIGFFNELIWKDYIPGGCIKSSFPVRDPTQQNILQVQGALFAEVLVAKYIQWSSNHVPFKEDNQDFRPFLLDLLHEAQDDMSQSKLNILALAATLNGALISEELSGKLLTFETEVESDLGKQLVADFFDYFRILFPDEVISPIIELPDGNGARYAKRVSSIYIGRSLFRTAEGHLGLGPGCMRQGDIVVVLDGGMVPYILRPLSGSSSEFYFMGECYVYDIAFDKGVAFLQQQWENLKTFRLV